ncbi:protein-L-isoaspartate(D-aspartate) O-methyltransferase [Actinomadura litoris]|uniref:protein-L-isoaspartate(D-aspartate) O-methyltransferase n=1 Tax=Actinomadura litoris TaxID=2678616 RepID=UPI001FA7803F|nr:protein-L-isoaspartate(D-aspartate) O-methyltransferase [Actinomadura litoris]
MKPFSGFIEELADQLAASGRLSDPAWRAALHAVPRHLFAPPLAWVQGGDGSDRLMDRAVDEEAWLEAVYSDASIAVQFDDGATPLEAGGENHTSSLSAPGVVIAFLELLGPMAHHRVLEIGTGTGWTAGLLAARVGDENVTSVEIDGALSASVGGNLKAAGRSPRLIVADGADGWPAAAPYDRAHVTCGVREVPYAWVEQTRPGGRVVFPWVPGFGYGHKVRLTVTADGRAIGGFCGNAGYMMLRSQRFEHYAPTIDAEGEPSTTRLDPHTVTGDSYGCDVAALVPGLAAVEEETGEGGVRLHLRDPEGSWALADYEPGHDDHLVLQAGPRRLWTEVETAYLRWVSWGGPDRDRFGITITPPRGQNIWLNSPDNPITP